MLVVKTEQENTIRSTNIMSYAENDTKEKLFSANNMYQYLKEKEISLTKKNQ